VYIAAGTLQQEDDLMERSEVRRHFEAVPPAAQEQVATLVAFLSTRAENSSNTDIPRTSMHIADPRQVPGTVFLYTLHPARVAMLTEGPTAEEQALAAEHWAYSQKLLAGGSVVFAGRTLTRDADSFATVVIRAESEDAARAVMEGDPAVKGGVFQGRLFPYQPMLMGEWPPEAVTVQPAGA
jgi:uncharacterized protein YciI